MNAERQRAIRAFDKLWSSRLSDGMTFENAVRLAAIATDYPEKALRAALIAEKEAKG